MSIDDKVQGQKGLMEKIGDYTRSGYGKVAATILGTVAMYSVMNTDLENRTLSPKASYAAEQTEAAIRKSIPVDEYYAMATPVDDPDMPKGLRVMPFYGKGIDGDNTEITTEASELPDTHKDGKFTQLYSNSSIREVVNEKFEKYGLNSRKIENFFDRHKNESALSIYHDGYILLFDAEKEKSYIFPISKECVKDLTS